MRVLVVEDEKKVAAFIQSGLEQEGYAPILREAGLEAEADEGGDGEDA